GGRGRISSQARSTPTGRRFTSITACRSLRSMTRYHAPRRSLRGTSACRRANNMAITAPGEGDDDGRGHNIVISASSGGSGVVPADVEIAVAFGTAHAGRALFQPSAFPAVRSEDRRVGDEG